MPCLLNDLGKQKKILDQLKSEEVISFYKNHDFYDLKYYLQYLNWNIWQVWQTEMKYFHRNYFFVAHNVVHV